MNPNENHQLIIGGITLISDGRLATVTSPVCVYENLTPENVQEFWNLARSRGDIVNAMDEFRDKMSSILIDIGNVRQAKAKGNPDVSIDQSTK